MDGVLNINKPASFTSHDVVAKARRILGEKKVGHLGTLDPLATGVLPLAVGAATRLVEFSRGTKEYVATCLLGRETDSGDVTGALLAEKDALSLDPSDVRRAVQALRDTTEQVPPMVSAVKKNGVKLYELARKGVVVERAARPVHIDEVELLELRLPRVIFRVVCSGGTYVRVLCQDLGKSLGTGGCLESLQRTRVGPFRLEDSVTLEGLKERVESGTLSQVLLPAQVLVEDWPCVRLAERELADFRLGKKTGTAEKGTGWVRVLDAAGGFRGIGTVEISEGESRLIPKKVFGMEGPP